MHVCLRYDPDLRIVQLPVQISRLLAVTVVELECDLILGGPAGEWPWAALAILSLPDHIDVDPVWPLGDSAPLAFTALRHATATYEVGSVNPSRLHCTGLDPRLVYGYIFARLGWPRRALTSMVYCPA